MNTLLIVMAVVATAITVEQLVSWAIAFWLPLLVGLVTKRTTNPGVKAGLLMALNAINGLMTEFIQSSRTDTDFDILQAAFTALVAWSFAMSSHFGFLRPTGLTEKAQNAGVT